MRICVLTTSYPRSESDDAGIFIKRLVDAYSALGASGLVIVPRDNFEPEEAVEANFLISRFRYGIFSKGSLAFGAGIVPNIKSNPLRLFQAPMLFLKMALQARKRRNEFDAVHANWISSGIAARLLGASTGRPYILTLRGEDVRLLSLKLVGPILLPILRGAKFITTVNEDFAGMLRGKFKVPDEKIVIIPNGVKVELPPPPERRQFAKRHGLDPSGKYLLFVGTIIPRKRIEILLDLLSAPSLHEYSLILCGRTEDEGYVREMMILAQNKNVSARVKFMGKVAPSDIPYFLSLSHCYVSASSFEGRSNSVLEALAAGVPVCLSDISAHREVVSPDGAFFFSGENLIEAERYILKLNQPEFRLKVIESGKSAVRDFTWQAAAKRYLELLASIV